MTNSIRIASSAHPWIEDEVASLVGYQTCGYCHEFTGDGQTPLLPTKEGWIEVEGDPVVQDWAHAFMLDWSWNNLNWKRTHQGA